MLHAQQRAEHVGVECGRVTLSGLIRDRTRDTFRASSVDRYVQATEPLHGLIDQAAHVFLVANVGAHEFCLCAQLADFSNELFAFLLTAAGDNDARALSSESDRSGATDSCQCAGNQNNW